MATQYPAAMSLPIMGWACAAVILLFMAVVVVSLLKDNDAPDNVEEDP